MQELQGRVAVVTGGASGIGFALAKAFLAEGMKVVIADVEKPALEGALEQLARSGGGVDGVVTDVSSDGSVNALAQHVFAAHGACHILCNNAGVSVPNLNIWETEPTDWAWVQGVNVGGVVNGIRAFVPRMLASGEEGLILNTSSGNGGVAPMKEQAVYAVTKAGVSILTECLAAQLAAAQSKLRAAIFYPAGGVLKTGIWTTKRNRPPELARHGKVPAGAEMTWEEFTAMMKKLGMELPIQDLDELARTVIEGIRNDDFVIMIGREGMEAQLTERAAKLARGECPTV